MRQPGQNFILLRGSIPAGHAPIKLDFSMTDPEEIAADTLKQILEARGIKVTGGVRVKHAEPPLPFDSASLLAGGAVGLFPGPGTLNGKPAQAVNTLVLADHLSPPLLESVGVTNKVSQNLHAELFLRTVAREKTGIGSADAGLWVEQNFLKALGIEEGEVVLSDGSGLSRDDLVTPRAVIQLLRYISQQPWGDDYVATFPIAGVDGTLENRMKDTAAWAASWRKPGRWNTSEPCLDMRRRFMGNILCLRFSAITILSMATMQRPRSMPSRSLWSKPSGPRTQKKK